MKHIELKQHDIVLFKRYSDTLQGETYQDGSVIAVRKDAKLVCISWLEGYKSRVDEVPFDKVIVKSVSLLFIWHETRSKGSIRRAKYLLSLFICSFLLPFIEQIVRYLFVYLLLLLINFLIL